MQNASHPGSINAAANEPNSSRRPTKGHLVATGIAPSVPTPATAIRKDRAPADASGGAGRRRHLAERRPAPTGSPLRLEPVGATMPR